MKILQKTRGFSRTIICMSIVFALTLTQAVYSQIDSWHSRGIGGGGALFYPQVNPHNTNELYIACDMALLFHSTNKGESWEIVHFRNLKTSSSTIIQYTSDPNIMYVKQFEFESYSWFPVKSTDGGKTFNKLPTMPTTDRVYFVYADNKSTDRLIFSTSKEIYFSDDSGVSWQKIYTNPGDEGVYVCGVFWDTEKIFIGTGRGVLISTDNGSTFTILNTPGIPDTDGLFSFAGSKKGDITRLVCVTAPLSEISGSAWGNLADKFNDILKLDYGSSNSWVSCKAGLPAERDIFFVSMAEDNIDTIYLGGGDSQWGFPAVLKTTDGGMTWNDVFKTVGNENIATGWAGNKGDYDFWWGGTALGFTVCKSNPDIAIVTDYGYCHITTDGGKSWAQMYVNKQDENPAGAVTPKGRHYRGIGMENTGAYSVAWVDSLNMFVGYSDIMGIRSEDGGVSWTKKYSGLQTNTISRVVTHPTSKNLYAVTSSVHELYSEIAITDAKLDNGKGAVVFSKDKGVTWETMHDFEKPVVWIEPDPNDENTLYASVIHSQSGGIFISNDIQNGTNSTWTKLTNPPRTEGHPNLIRVLDDGTLVCSYSGRRANNAFTQSSGVFTSSDNGQTWSDVSDPGMHYWTMDIVIDKHDKDQNIWYAGVFSGWGGAPNGLGGVYRTKNRGANWERILKQDRIFSCTNHPDNPDILYVASHGKGIQYTKNLLAATPTFTPDEKYRYQNPRRIYINPYQKNEIWVTSGGYGVTCGHIENTTIEQNTIITGSGSSPDVLFNPLNRKLQVSFYSDYATKLTLTIYNSLGKKIQVLIDNQHIQQGNWNVQYTTEIKASGVCLLRFSGYGFNVSKRFVVF